MKNWNRTGKIKAIILGLLALPTILFPIGATGQQGLVMILMPLIFGSIAIPLITMTRNIDEYILIEHIGISDKPIPTLIISKTVINSEEVVLNYLLKEPVVHYNLLKKLFIDLRISRIFI